MTALVLLLLVATCVATGAIMFVVGEVLIDWRWFERRRLRMAKPDKDEEPQRMPTPQPSPTPTPTPTPTPG